MQKVLWLTKVSTFFHKLGVGFQSVLAMSIGIAALGAIWLLPEAQVTFENVSKVIELALMAMGLLSIVLLSAQIRQTAVWNETLSYHEHFGDLVPREQAKEMKVLMRKHEFLDDYLKCKALSSTVAQELFDSDESQTFITSYLDEFEEFCAAINRGLVDYEYAIALEGKRVSRAWHVFKPFIEKIRLSNDDPCCYAELERVAIRWVDFEDELRDNMKKNRRIRHKSSVGS